MVLVEPKDVNYFRDILNDTLLLWTFPNGAFFISDLRVVLLYFKFHVYHAILLTKR